MVTAMETTLLKDRHWAAVDGHLCLVTEFTPLASVGNGQVKAVNLSLPYAGVRLRSAGSAVEYIGYICHRIDFSMLWAAFNERTQVPGVRVELHSEVTFPQVMRPGPLAENEEAWLIWSRKNYRPWTFFRSIMPKLVVMVSKKGAFELLQKIGKNPSLKEASLTALITWTPEVMNKLDYSRS